MNYAAKPLDVSPGRRLYRVSISFPQHPAWNTDKFALASSPSHAADIMRDIHHDTTWQEEPVIQGHAVSVYQIHHGGITSVKLSRTDTGSDN